MFEKKQMSLLKIFEYSHVHTCTLQYTQNASTMNVADHKPVLEIKLLMLTDKIGRKKKLKKPLLREV